jgi:spore germination protein YaaH
VRALQSHGIKVIPTLVDMRNGDWAPQFVTSMLSSQADRDRHVQAIIELVDTVGYDGVDIDYEQMRAEDREAYSSFLRELAQPLHERGKLLTSGVYAKQSEPGDQSFNIAEDYAAIGQASDQVRVQTFEYHYEDSDPGPIAPLDQVEATIAFAVTRIPAKKVILGAMLLGYDWPIGGKGQTVSYQQAMDLSRTYGSVVRHEGPGGSPTFGYTDSNGHAHEVWFEDAQSTKGKLEVAQKYGVGGVFFWRLGGEDPATWDLPELAKLR